VPNFDFDDNTLQVLDSTRISNLEQPWLGAILYKVGINTHKQFEVLMTLAPVINEGVSCLSFRLDDEDATSSLWIYWRVAQSQEGSPRES
jgi:hypothetical protein